MFQKFQEWVSEIFSSVLKQGKFYIIPLVSCFTSCGMFLIDVTRQAFNTDV